MSHELGEVRLRFKLHGDGSAVLMDCKVHQLDSAGSVKRSLKATERAALARALAQFMVHLI